MKDLGLCNYYDENTMDNLFDGSIYIIHNNEFNKDEDIISDKKLKFIINSFQKCLSNFENSYNIQFVYHRDYEYYSISMNKVELSLEEDTELCNNLRSHLENYKIDFY